MAIGTELFSLYSSFTSALPPFLQQALSFFVIVLMVVIYAIFIWKLYRFVARKNIIELNLSQYNKSEHAFFSKFFATILYIAEYILILPFLIFFWFAVFTLFLIFLTEGLEVSAILIISATIIAAIRMVSYYSNDLAKDLAKLLPFTLLAISITKPGFFQVENIFNHLSQIPAFFNQITVYLAFIIILEIVLRLFESFFELIGITSSDEEKGER